MQLKDKALNKVILLFVMDCMEIPLKIDTLTEICDANKWVGFMDCKDCVVDLIEVGHIVDISKNNEKLYILSNKGKECLSIFYKEIPLSKRDEIKATVKEQRCHYRRLQDYFSDYFMNDDGSYTVILRINTPAQPLLDLKLCVQNKARAKWLYKNWIDKAPSVYEFLHTKLLE